MFKAFGFTQLMKHEICVMCDFNKLNDLSYSDGGAGIFFLFGYGWVTEFMMGKNNVYFSFEVSVQPQ